MVMELFEEKGPNFNVLFFEGKLVFFFFFSDLDLSIFELPNL